MSDILERLRFYIGECTRLHEQLVAERQRARRLIDALNANEAEARESYRGFIGDSTRMSEASRAAKLARDILAAVEQP